MKRIWADDIRQAPKGYDTHCYSVNEAIDCIQKQKDNIELLDLDHDAGDFFSDGGDYIRILDWLEMENISIPIRIHSGNPVGCRNMERIIQRNGWTLIY